ncbi:hypothetical protein [Halogeometricum limi]|nr:hypothetical protein [Halogeometricum limi]
MALQTSFDALSEIVEQFESDGRTLRSIEASTGDASSDALRVAMDVPLSLLAPEGSCPDLTPSGASLTADGGLCVEFDTDAVDELVATSDAVVSAETRDVSLSPEAELVVSVVLHIDPDGDSPRRIETDGHADVGAGGTTDVETESAATPTVTETSDSGTDANDAGVADDADGSAPTVDDDTADDETDELAAVRDESVPPYEDTPYLRHLYDTCETFVEMSRKIEMDVASETVRRYMIEAGVHDPTSYDTQSTSAEPSTSSKPSMSSEPSTSAEPSTPQSTSVPETGSERAETDAAESSSDDAAVVDEPDAPESAAAEDAESVPTEQLVTDGLGLPDDCRIEDVVDAVVESTTLFEVQRRLDMDRQPTQELLRQLNLLDLVVHRVADGPKRRVSYEDVATRIRQCTPTTA